VFAFLLRLTLVLVIARLVVRGLVALLGSPARRPGTGSPGAPSIETSEMVRDRTCNTFLPRDRALVAVLGGQQEFFCSAACRDRRVAALRRAS
jgi:hypothetical protein